MPSLRALPSRLRFAALQDFLHSEAAGGAILMISAAAALVWANSAAGGLYRTLLNAPLLHETPLIWINDGLMAVFFLLVGLELRREITQGELASPARLAAPGLAALGGMAAPALILVALNWRDPVALRGWAVPVATDIAFALAVLAVLGRRVPVGLKVFLTALAIMDDLGAILVIALFYTKGLNLWDLGGAVLVWLGLLGLNRAGVRALWPYLAGGAVLWLLVFQSGVHATLAGVALAFVVPMRADPGAGAGADANVASAPAQILEHRLGSWVAYAILPLFGLANAGLRFDTLPPHAWTNRLALGTALGLFLGKQLGVFGAVMAASRLGLARLPAGVTWPQLYGGAVLCGIGFTMSLFIGDLAFRGSSRGDEVKLAVFIGSLASALAGLAILAVVSRNKAPAEPPHPHSIEDAKIAAD